MNEPSKEDRRLVDRLLATLLRRKFPRLHPSVDQELLEVEGRLAGYCALETYSPDRGSKRSSWIALHIHCRLCNLMRDTRGHPKDVEAPIPFSSWQESVERLNVCEYPELPEDRIMDERPGTEEEVFSRFFWELLPKLLTPEQWTLIKERVWEEKSCNELGKRYGVSHQAILNRERKIHELIWNYLVKTGTYHVDGTEG